MHSILLERKGSNDGKLIFLTTYAAHFHQDHYNCSDTLIYCSINPVWPGIQHLENGRHHNMLKLRYGQQHSKKLNRKTRKNNVRAV
uniref:Uncharacterized protein n=1 Tax=Romanomermis culicivorax TaxID=13658 RepID=A0A915J5C7_ROMCU